MDKYRGVDYLSTSWVKKNKLLNSKLIQIPVIYYRAQLPQCFPLIDYHDERLAYHDAHALEFFIEGKSSEDFLEETGRSDFFSADFVRSEAFLTALELLRRENISGCDILVSDIIAACLLNSQPLFSINHPSRAVLVEVCNRILHLLDLKSSVVLDGPEYLDQFIMAPYLSTALGLGHSGMGLRLDEVRSRNIWESRQEYYREVFNLYQEIGVDALRQSISKHGEIQAYLDRFHRSKGCTPTEDRRKLIDTLYKTFLGRLPNSNDVLHHLQTLEHHGYDTLVTTFPKSPEFYARGGGEALGARFPIRRDE